MVGSRIADRLAVIGMSNQQLADEVGVTHESISRYIHGKAEPRVSVAWRIAKTLGTTLDYLLDEDCNYCPYCGRKMEGEDCREYETHADSEI